MIVTRRVEPGYEAVAAAFADAFTGRPEMGGALAVLHHGRVVVDVLGGTRDRRTGLPWDDDTLSVIFSCTKGLVSLLLARLVQEGRVGYDDLMEWFQWLAERLQERSVSDGPPAYQAHRDWKPPR